MDPNWHMELIKNTIVKFYKEASHEFILTSSCHSVLFRGYINKQLQITPPLHGYNPQAEIYYERITESLALRFRKIILDPLSYGEKISTFLNELSTCEGAVHDMHDYIQNMASQTTYQPLLDSLQLFLYSFQYILQKLNLIETLYKREFLLFDFCDIDFDSIPTQQQSDDFFN